MTLDTKHFKELLEKEILIVENQLSYLGRKNPANPADWEAVSPELNRDRADETEVADNIEQYESATAILNQLEIRLSNLKMAFEKIDKNIYGICEVDSEPIELDRLEANPAARTCKKHMEM